MNRTKKLILSAGAFIALVAVVCLAGSYFHSVEKKTVKDPLYVYVGGIRTDYPDGCKFRHKDNTMYVVNGKDSQVLPDVMFYYADKDAVFLQESMIWNQKSPADQKRLDYFGEVSLENGVVQLESGSARIQNPGGFLYNGKNEYLLLEDAVLEWGDGKRDLSPLSSVTAEYGETLEIYDYKSGTAESIRLEEGSVMLTFSDGTQVDVTTDKMYQTNGSWYLLLTDPGVLKRI